MLVARHVFLEGNHNLRDLGGYRGAGGEVRHGCVFRSDDLSALTERDVQRLAELGIRVIVDLRNESERVLRPSRLPDGIEVLVRTSPSSGGDLRTTEEQIAAGALPVRDDEMFAGIYVDLFERLAPELSVLVTRAVDAPARPLLFHCHAGKDRTGIAASVLLGLLGVAEDDILDDYELTTRYYTPRRMDSLAALMAEHGVADETVRHLLTAHRVVLSSALTTVLGKWGGWDGYATGCLGVPGDLPGRLRDALLA